jgi:hypothetical protein
MSGAAPDSRASRRNFARRSFSTGRCSFISDWKKGSLSSRCCPIDASPARKLPTSRGTRSINCTGCRSVTSGFTLQSRSEISVR